MGSSAAATAATAGSGFFSANLGVNATGTTLPGTLGGTANSSWH